MKTHDRFLNACSFYSYRIFWEDGSVDSLQAMEDSEWFQYEPLDQIAIVSASNPGGRILTEKENRAVNFKLENVLRTKGIYFLPVVRDSLNKKTMKEDGKERSKAFLIYELSEEQVKELLAEFQADFFLYFCYQPFELFIHLVGAGRFKNQRAIFFRHND